jgi:hypothetical protein
MTASNDHTAEKVFRFDEKYLSQIQWTVRIFCFAEASIFSPAGRVLPG